MDGPRRPSRVLLPRYWDFRRDPHAEGVWHQWYLRDVPGPWQPIDVTIYWELQGHADEAGNNYIGKACYRCSFKLPDNSRTRRSSSASPGLPTGWSTTGASGSGVMTCCWTEAISTTPPTTRMNGISPARLFPARAIRWLFWCTPHRLPFGSTAIFTAVSLSILPHWPPGPGMEEYRRATDYVDEDAGHRIDGYRSCGQCGSIPGVKLAGGLYRHPLSHQGASGRARVASSAPAIWPPRRNRSFTG